MIDCTWNRSKNIHLINTIEIYFHITTNNTFSIEYRFHKIDFDIWKNILWFHKRNIKETILYDENNLIILEPINTTNIYNYYRLESKEFNLYRNIQSIPILEYKQWNNINKQIILNTWNGGKLLK